jgi:hypothetical protein
MEESDPRDFSLSKITFTPGKTAKIPESKELAKEVKETEGLAQVIVAQVIGDWF